jgi:hypothetical protein
VIADVFTESAEQVSSAFAAVYFANGLTSSLGFFTYTISTRYEMAYELTVSTSLGLICYWILVIVYQQYYAPKTVGPVFEL